MLIVYVTLALLAVAVCVLYAMVGELASRVLRPDELRRPVQALETKPIDGISLGAAVPAVPAVLGSPDDRQVAAPTDFGLVVLTTICTSCRAFASAFGRSPTARRLPEPLFVLVSAPTPADAQRFAVETGLRDVPDLTVLFDELGRWCHRSIGLNVAPSFIRVVDGRIAGAWSISTFTDVVTLWEPVAQRDVPVGPQA